MEQHLIKIVWGCMLFSFTLPFFISVATEKVFNARFYLFTLVFAIGLAALVYMTFRMVVFRKKLLLFVRRLLSGNYETGIKLSSGLNDEITHLEKMLNRLGDQLRTYDTLRAQRVALSYRALDILCQTVSQGIIMAKIDKRVLQLNPSAQAVWGVENPTVSLDAIENLPENKEFMALLRSAVERDKVPVEGHVRLQLPMRDSGRNLAVKITPLKDATEKVALAFIFLKPDNI